jgi:hypothetical protein
MSVTDAPLRPEMFLLKPFGAADLKTATARPQKRWPGEDLPRTVNVEETI